MSYDDVIQFWFGETEPQQRWRRCGAFDRTIKRRFRQTHEAAVRCELYEWRRTTRGRLAEIIVLDQFSRNIHRGSPLAYAFDSMALCLSQEAISRGMNGDLSVEERCFSYMPFMHSESRKIHDIAVTLFSAPGLESNLEYEMRHKEIIDRFGRYPHRNEVLARRSTPEELAFLEQPGSSF